MIDKLTKLFLKKIEERFIMNIMDADKDQLKSYGFIVTGKNGSLKIMEKKNTFKECFPVFQQYIDRYGLDNFSLSILDPDNTISKRLFTDEWGYDQLHRFLKEIDHCSSLKIIGSNKINRKEEAVYIKGDVSGKKLYIDEVAFHFFRDYVCYIPVNRNENDPDSWYTRNMIVELCQKDEYKAIQLLDKLATGEYTL